MAKKADEVKKGYMSDGQFSKEEAQNFYSGKEEYKETEQLKEEPKGKNVTVIGIIEAEKLQKSGWRLVSAARTSDDPFSDKEYKFERNK